MNTNDPRTPIVQPVLDLLRSRAFIVMIVTALVNMIIIAVPEFAQYRDDLIGVVTGLALAVIGKMALEDSAQKYGDAKAKGAPTTVNAGTADVTVTPPANDAATSGQG